MNRVKGVRVILVMEEGGDEDEMVVVDAAINPDDGQSITASIENGFFVYEAPDGKREFKPNGNQTVTIFVKRSEL